MNELYHGRFLMAKLKVTQYTLYNYSMATANLKKSEEFVTNTTAASKYIPRRPRISINWNPPFQTSLHKILKVVFFRLTKFFFRNKKDKVKKVWKVGFQLMLILGLLGMYFDVVVIFVTKSFYSDWLWPYCEMVRNCKRIINKVILTNLDHWSIDNTPLNKLPWYGNCPSTASFPPTIPRLPIAYGKSPNKRMNPIIVITIFFQNA